VPHFHTSNQNNKWNFYSFDTAHGELVANGKTILLARWGELLEPLADIPERDNSNAPGD
jgi:hypothetical protein